jgi:hypothetical protein
LFRSKAIAAFATVACVFTAQQGSAGNAEFIAARPSLMVLPVAAIAPVAIAASATAETAVFDYESPARQIVFPGMEEQMLDNSVDVRVPVPAFKPSRAAIRSNGEARPAKVRPVVRVKAEPKRIVAASAFRLTNPMQPIIGAFR